MHTKLVITTAVALAAMAAPAPAAINLCVPKTAGQTAFSGGTDPETYCAGSQAVRMPDTAADQQKLIDLLPYVSFQSAGIGGKPTITIKGANVNLRKGNEYVSRDGTGNLILGTGVNYKQASGHEGSENLVIGWDNAWTGSQNAIVGGFHKANGNINIVGGRQNTADGSGNLIGGGLGHKVTSHLGAITGGSWQTLNQEYGSIADGVGKDVFKVRVANGDNGTDRSMVNQKIQTWSYAEGIAYVYLPGVDTRKCAVAATPRTADPNRTAPVIPSDYTDWVLINMYNGSARAQFPVDVTVNCAR